MGYYNDAKSDAQETAREYRDAIVEQLMDDGEASDDLLNDYGNGDAYHHESHVDKWYSLSDAAAVLSELSDYEETDSGLWEGQAPRDAISTQAAFTYGAAVYSLWADLVGKINDAAADAVAELEDAWQAEDDAREDAEAEYADALAEYQADLDADVPGLLPVPLSEVDADALESSREAAKKTAVENAVDAAIDNF